MISAITPDWPAPPSVRALSTTRHGGASVGAWSSMNLGANCGDDPGHVRKNRERLGRDLPSSPFWLHQVHGATVALHGGREGAVPAADAVVSFASREVCAVLTADCLPVLFCDRPGTRVAAAHAGWRGLAAGVLQATVAELGCPPGELIAWLGPAIGPAVYEVGREVADAFPDELERGLRPRGDRWLMDLCAVARRKLAGAGLTAVFGGDFCTYSDPERFYSYRRDGVTGRMATLIWLEENQDRSAGFDTSPRF
jgi:YfiH family protein